MPEIQEESINCGESSTCPDLTTCCRLPNREWGCCPFPNAVCCQDHIHCCPQGTHCDPEGLQCLKSNGEIFLPGKKSKAQAVTEEDEIICPDRRSKCPSGSTCCMLLSGKYGCCPAVEANCCADHLHCCPNGFTCDTSGQRCIHEKARTSLP
ncbi:granulin [Cooperia oncophora]